MTKYALFPEALETGFFFTTVVTDGEYMGMKLDHPEDNTQTLCCVTKLSTFAAATLYNIASEWFYDIGVDTEDLDGVEYLKSFTAMVIPNKTPADVQYLFGVGQSNAVPSMRMDQRWTPDQALAFVDMVLIPQFNQGNDPVLKNDLRKIVTSLLSVIIFLTHVRKAVLESHDPETAIEDFTPVMVNYQNAGNANKQITEAQCLFSLGYDEHGTPNRVLMNNHDLSGASEMAELIHTSLDVLTGLLKLSKMFGEVDPSTPIPYPMEQNDFDQITRTIRAFQEGKGIKPETINPPVQDENDSQFDFIDPEEDEFRNRQNLGETLHGSDQVSTESMAGSVNIERFYGSFIAPISRQVGELTNSEPDALARALWDFRNNDSDENAYHVADLMLQAAQANYRKEVIEPFDKVSNDDLAALFAQMLGIDPSGVKVTDVGRA